MKEGIDDTRALVMQRMEQRGCEQADLVPVARAFQEVFQPMARCRTLFHSFHSGETFGVVLR